MGSYLTCNHSKSHFLYEAACSYCSSEFLLLCFWLQGPWGHYWALKTLSIPTCNPLTDPTHEPGALFKFRLGLQLLQLQMLCDAGLQLSHNPDLALNSADPDLPHHYKLGWWFEFLMDSSILPDFLTQVLPGGSWPERSLPCWPWHLSHSLFLREQLALAVLHHGFASLSSVSSFPPSSFYLLTLLEIFV